MGLIGWWKLNGDINDYSGYENHGVSTSMTYTDGKFGQSASFWNSNVITANLPFLISKYGFSVCYWAQHDGNTTAYNHRKIFEIFDTDGIRYFYCDTRETTNHRIIILLKIIH